MNRSMIILQDRLLRSKTSGARLSKHAVARGVGLCVFASLAINVMPSAVWLSSAIRYSPRLAGPGFAASFNGQSSVWRGHPEPRASRHCRRSKWYIVIR